MPAHIIIPARLDSSRLPNKPLLPIHGVPMILWTAQKAAYAVQMGMADSFWVATDDVSIYQLCQSKDIPVLMTKPTHLSGTDRLAEACRLLDLADTDIVINMQGDEPFVAPILLSQVKELLVHHSDCVMATLCEPIGCYDDLVNRSVVKVVMAQNKALYFSRSPIPYHRDDPQNFDNAHRHLGIYAYRVGLLHAFGGWQAGVLERLESLEQLRILENGQSVAIDVAQAHSPLGVDTQKDLDKLNALPYQTLLGLGQDRPLQG